MRLSDAMATGRVLIKRFTPHQTLYRCEGCAMGAALMAVGEKLGNAHIVYKHWPWLEEERAWIPGWNKMQGWEAITEKFYDVTKKIITFDQLIDWVRSVEPAEETQPETQTEEVAVEVARTGL